MLKFKVEYRTNGGHKVVKIIRFYKLAKHWVMVTDTTFLGKTVVSEEMLYFLTPFRRMKVMMDVYKKDNDTVTCKQMKGIAF